jgi:hypothetical protein
VQGGLYRRLGDQLKIIQNWRTLYSSFAALRLLHRNALRPCAMPQFTAHPETLFHFDVTEKPAHAESRRQFKN